MSKKLKDLKKTTRNAARGGRNGRMFERFIAEHNTRIQSPARAMAESGAHFAEGFSAGTARAHREITGER